MTAFSARVVSDLVSNYVQSTFKSEAPVPSRADAVPKTFSELDAPKRSADLEAAGETVSRHLDYYACKYPLPPLISHFLETHWRSHLIRLCLHEGENGEGWRRALENTEDLTWSVTPKRDAEGRKRLFAILPELFQWVHGVLKSQEVTVSDENAFFAKLAQIHAATLATDVNAVAGSTLDSVSALASEPSVDRDGIGGDRNVDIARTTNPRSLQSETDAEPMVMTDELNSLRGLVVGASVEFQNERATKRVMCLEWISKGGIYFFRDREKHDAVCITASRCIQRLRERSALVLS